MRFKKLDREPFPIEMTDENIQMAKDFLLEKWIDRHKELYFDTPIPTDLSDSCKFSALFSSVVFGGEIAGNYDHVFTLIDDEVFDLNEDAKDVDSFEAPYEEDDDFISSEDFEYSIKTCVPRVKAWVDEFSLKFDVNKTMKI